MDIGKNQIELIDYAKKYISMINGTGVNISKSAYCWLVPVPGAPGYFILKRLYNKGKLTLKSIYFFFKYFIGIAILHDYKIINRISNLEKNYNRLIISFAWKNNFNNDGSYTDNYLNLNSKQDLKNLWFLIYLEDDGKIPNKIDKNILIFGKENLKRKYCFFYLLKVFFNIIKNSKSSLTKIFHESSRPSHYSEIVIKEVTNLIKSLNFKSILMSYENQPFQNGIFESVKKINNNIKLIGYLHSTQPLPVLHICRSGSPDLLLVHGDDQIFHLKKYLNWHDSKLKLIPALRYNKNNIKKFGNNLVLPINLSNEKILLNQFDFFLKNKNNKSLKSFTIRNHPFRKNSKSHKIFIKNLENILSRYSDKFSNNIQNEISVFFGGTSSVLEALESGFKVNHICADPVFESYSEAIWPSIRVRAINDFLFEYELSHKGKCINLGSGDNIFEKYPEL
tara:strand:+ start:413 stop:1765 length:1353 start_codon:yes stop_codon:yes gene_type:complete